MICLIYFRSLFWMVGPCLTPEQLWVLLTLLQMYYCDISPFTGGFFSGSQPCLWSCSWAVKVPVSLLVGNLPILRPLWSRRSCWPSYCSCGSWGLEWLFNSLINVTNHPFQQTGYLGYQTGRAHIWQIAWNSCNLFLPARSSDPRSWSIARLLVI